MTNIDRAIVQLKQTEEFKRSSYSKIIRHLVETGLACNARKRKKEQ